MIAVFNQNPPKIGNQIPAYSQDTIENTLNLRQVSLEDAARYGGPITRAALGAMNFKGNRKHIVVDTKVNLLLDGFIPAIPGWHTDGVPRGEEMDPGGKGEPNLRAQVENRVTSSHYHLLVTGTVSQTEFINIGLAMDLVSDRTLYKQMSEWVNNWLTEEMETWKQPRESLIFTAPENTVVEWDWWNIHQAVPAKGRGWRYLIRATETDHIAPRTNPAEFIRTQSQVYVPTEFGW